MGTYTWVAAAVTAALALLLWLGPCDEASPASLTLSADGPWLQATLDNGSQFWELSPGRPLQLTPGSYRVTLFGSGGQTRRRDITVGDLDILLGAPGPADTSGRRAPVR